MMEELCPPCPEEKDWIPEVVEEICPCPEIVDDLVMPWTPTVSRLVLETDCYKEMLFNMTSKFLCPEVTAC